MSTSALHKKMNALQTRLASCIVPMVLAGVALEKSPKQLANKIKKGIATFKMDGTCNYNSLHDCIQQRIDGYDYCKDHILEDRAAPYRQCSFIYQINGRRCVVPAHKKENGGLCEEHTRQGQLMRQSAVKRHKPPATAESLLVSLAHYAKIEKKSVNSSFETNTNDGSAMDQSNEDALLNVETIESVEAPAVTVALDPFDDIDAFRVNSSISRVMDYASESESDLEPYTVKNQGNVSDSGSEIEGIDEKDELLRHAGIYSAEEVVGITRDKLVRLQSLYIEQFRRLQHTLRERRRTYLHTLKKEKETLSSIHNQTRETAHEQKLYDKLKSMNRYHKRNGVEAVLHKKELERRALVTEGMAVRPPPTVKCVYTEGGVKCGEKTLPVSKYCRRHILSDPNQALFRPCGSTLGGFDCTEPVLTVFKHQLCVYHTNISTVRPVKSTVRKPVEVASSVKVEAAEDPLADDPPADDSTRSAFDEDSKSAPTNCLDSASLAEKCGVATSSVLDNVENRLGELFGDSEATDTASEKEALNSSQNLDDFVDDVQ